MSTSVNQQSQDNPENLFEWMGSNRLFERYFFFYFLIIVVFVSIGIFTLGFEISGLSAKTNLLINVLWVFVLTCGMYFTPLWFRILLGRITDVLKDTQLVYQQLDELDEESHVVAKKQLANSGKLPPSKLQFFAMVFIGWYFLFEFCIVTTFVDKNHQLIWEPQLVQSLIKWRIENTITPVDYETQDRNFFSLHVNFKSIDFLKAPPFSSMQFSSELEFLNSPLGHTAMFFSLWRLFIVVPVLVAFIIAFGKMFGWLGLNGLNIYYTKGIVDFFGRVLFNIFVSFFLLVPWMLTGLSDVTEGMMESEWWLNNLYILVGIYIFAVFPLILIGGWFSALYKVFMNAIKYLKR